MAKDQAVMDEQIAAEVEEWSTNSTEAFHISLYQSDKPIHIFNPQFTYPIFGDEEAIFGYKRLKISLAFAAHNLQPHLDISYQNRFPDLGEIQATDIKGILAEFLPSSAFSDQKPAAAIADPVASTFCPPGKTVHSYKSNGKVYEIWCASLSDPAALSILENMQILVPLFIEGGTMLELDQPWIVERWKVFFLYEVSKDAPASSSRYSLAGYATSYRVYTFPDRDEDLVSTQMNEADFDNLISQSSPGALDGKDGNTPKSTLNLPSRERISQFIILPPYQGAGHGANLYNTMYTQLTAPPNIIELTVEDPNEAFDDLRDICDLLHLRRTNPDFASLKVTSTIDSAHLKPSEQIPIDEIVSGNLKERIRRASKIMPRQLSRLIEMQTLSKIPRSNRSVNRLTRKEKASNEFDRAFYLWRLYVKQRVYLQNRDALIQVDREERIERLEGVLGGLVDDYDRILEMVETRAEILGEGGEEEKRSGRKEKRGKKRRLVVDEEDEGEGDEVNEAVSVGKRGRKSSKRATVIDEDDDDEDEGEDIGGAFDD